MTACKYEITEFELLEPRFIISFLRTLTMRCVKDDIDKAT